MGQLIKLQDYVSRYEQNIYLYPSRYVRLKKQQWEKLHEMWESGASFERQTDYSTMEGWDDGGNPSIFERIKGLLSFRKKENTINHKRNEQEIEQPAYSFTPAFTIRPQTVEKLKKQFLDQIFSFQIKWASTTLTEKSFVSKKFYYDERLKYFLQRFPDTYLLLYHPIFLLKKAPVEVEHILITPFAVYCISFLEDEDLAVYVGSGVHFWIKKVKDREEKILNPLLSLDRTEKIVNKIFQMYEIPLPIHKIILSRNGYVDYPSAPSDVEFVEKRNYEKWFESMRGQRSPLKHVQLKAAQVLLQYCQTTSTRRLEWDLELDQDE